MTDRLISPYPDAAAIRRVGEGLLDTSLPRSAWDHAAHLAATLWLLRERRDLDLDVELGAIITRYNAAAGVPDAAGQGYHATLTRAFLSGVRAHIAARDPAEPLSDSFSALLASAVGARDWPLRFYSRERLFSAAARHAFIAPDLAPLPALC